MSKFSGLRGIKKGGEEPSITKLEIPDTPATQNAAEPKRLGRPKAKRSDTANFTQVSGYIPKHVYLAVKKRMLRDEELDGQRREFSVILAELLTEYAREFIA
jgi:hypothetical protein